MYQFKKNGKVFTSKYVGTEPSSYEKRIYRAGVSQRLRNTGIEGGEYTGKMAKCGCGSSELVRYLCDFFRRFVIKHKAKQGKVVMD